MKILKEEHPSVGADSVLSKVVTGAYVDIGEQNHIDHSVIGDYSYTGPWCIIQNTHIGKFSNIAAMVRIGPTDHPMERPSQHHFTYRRQLFGLRDTNDDTFFQKRRERITTIGHDSWIGHGAIILPEINIGIGSVIGAGSVVTKDVPPYGIVVGNPARFIRHRFDPSQIEQLLSIQWWDWSHDCLKERLEDFSLPIQEFIHKYQNNNRSHS
ncbi:chloramphenicol acetyltransferase [Spirochaeta cellobiosiphila]|uniref:chloramphenicol acetyltransferase n=1 Tax=Spirochaeta cellobiosiphila TaxID=504483 RepID=UPI00041A917D|nr:chloramphenicol acetyltransferase [Spirochaeta cellobiosiphila]